MPIASEPEVAHLDRIRSNISDQSRANQKTIAIILHAAPVVVVMQTALNCVALADKVLTEHVSDVDILMAGVETVQTAVCVLLQHGEICEIVLVSVGSQVTEDAHTRLIVEEDESPKIAVESLNAGARGDKIEG